MTDLPIYPKSSRTGVRGVNIVSRIINENLGWVFRETHNEHDFGIDGYLDVVNDNGEVTGQQFAVQVKYGEDYIKDQNPFGITYRGEKKHLRYYNNHPMPVLLLVGAPSIDKFLWEVFDVSKIISSDKSWTMTIPFSNDLKNDSGKLFKILPDLEDPADKLNEFWKMVGVVKSGGIAIAAISEEDVERRDYTFIQNFFSRIMQKAATAKHFQSSVEVTFDGDFDENIELYEIPAYRDYVSGLLDGIPQISYFLTKDNRFGLLAILVIFLGFRGKTANSYALLDKIEIDIDYSAFGEVIEKLFYGLNSVAEFVKIDEREVNDISRAVWRSITMPIP